MLKKLTLITFGLFLITIPVQSFAFDACLSAKSDVICKLQEQIRHLQAQLDTIRGLSTESQGESNQCLNLKNGLIIGSSDFSTDGEVSKLQCFLKVNGYFPDAECTGYYGEKTANAVVRWQKAHGMDFVTTKSGVGPMTRAKMKCESPVSTVQKISWIIENANPTITDENDFKMFEQAISIDVTQKDNSTKRYNVGKAYGCEAVKQESIPLSENILGKVQCYYALSGVDFIAYNKNGKFIVERQAESPKDGSISKTTALEL